MLLQPGPIDWPSTARVALVPNLLVALILTLPIFFSLRWLMRDQL
jgi:hypothetical protein